MRDWGGRNSVAAYKYFWHRAMHWWWWWWLLGGGRKWSLLTCFLDINYQHCLHHVQSVFITLSLSRFACIAHLTGTANIILWSSDFKYKPQQQVALSWETIKISEQFHSCASNKFPLQISTICETKTGEFNRAFVRFLIELLHRQPSGTILEIKTSGDRDGTVHNVFNAMSETHLQDSDSDLASMVSAGHVNITVLLGLHQWSRLRVLQHRHGEEGGH